MIIQFLLLPCFKASAPALSMSWLLRCTLSFSSHLATPVPFCFFSCYGISLFGVVCYLKTPSFLIGVREKSNFFFNPWGVSRSRPIIYVKQMRARKKARETCLESINKSFTSPAQAHGTILMEALPTEEPHETKNKTSNSLECNVRVTTDGTLIRQFLR